MKSILKIILLACVVYSVYSCSSAEASKRDDAKKSSHTEDLKELGFFNTKSSVVLMKEEILNKYGLLFITDSEMDSIVNTHGFICNSSSLYIGEIPAESAKQIVQNYKKVESHPHYYLDRGWWPIGFAGSKDKGILVVAPPEYFNPGTVHLNGDPIVVIKIDGGWIQLARWE